jgi:hypothetical protein
VVRTRAGQVERRRGKGGLPTTAPANRLGATAQHGGATDKRTGLHHLHGAAGEPEGHRHHGSLARPVDELIQLRHDKLCRRGAQEGGDGVRRSDGQRAYTIAAPSPQALTSAALPSDHQLLQALSCGPDETSEDDRERWCVRHTWQCRQDARTVGRRTLSRRGLVDPHAWREGADAGCCSEERGDAIARAGSSLALVLRRLRRETTESHLPRAMRGGPPRSKAGAPAFCLTDARHAEQKPAPLDGHRHR